jgi:hypothetical protein
MHDPMQRPLDGLSEPVSLSFPDANLDLTLRVPQLYLSTLHQHWA